jgi:hypothetical protein
MKRTLADVWVGVFFALIAWFCGLIVLAQKGLLVAMIIFTLTPLATGLWGYTIGRNPEILGEIKDWFNS